MSEKFPAKYHIFESLTAHVLEKHAPTKKAIIRENNESLKGAKKKIMHR